MDTCVSISSYRHQVMACRAATAMVDTIRPVRGFSTQFPLASTSLTKRALVLKRTTHSNFQNHPSLLHYGNISRGLSVSAHMGHLPEPETIKAHVELAHHLLTNSFLTLADAAVSADGALEATGVKNSDGWLGGLTDTLAKILIFLKDGLSTLKVPYAYGFAIILLTLLVKAATFPLTKQQVESTISMQNLQPQIKALQARYAGDQERIQLETARLYKQAGVNPLAGCLPTLATIPVWIGLYRALSNVANEGLLTEGFFWIPSLGGPTTIASRAGGSGTAWLFPFENGVPPLGWADTIAYLVLPVLLVGSQFFSMQIMQPPQSNDPAQKNSQLILKFLPLMIGYFSLSVPSGLSLYWLTNNILSTAQQVYLRNGKAMVPGDPTTTIITPGQAKRSGPPAIAPPAALKEIRSFKEDRRGERFKELKRQEAERKAKQREASAKAQVGGETKPLENSKQREASAKAQVGGETKPLENSTNGSAGEDGEEEDIIDIESEDKLEVYTNGTGDQNGSSVPKRGKRSKRTRAN